MTWRPCISIVNLLQQWSVTWERTEGQDSNVCQTQVLDTKIKNHWRRVRWGGACSGMWLDVPHEEMV